MVQHVVNERSIGSLDVTPSLPNLQLEAMTPLELMGLWLEMNIVGMCLRAMSLCIFIIVFGLALSADVRFSYRSLHRRNWLSKNADGKNESSGGR